MVIVRQGLVIALFLLVLPIVAAAPFSLVVQPVNVEIFRNESATYDVSISNFGTDDAIFQVYTIDPLWTTKTEPLDLTVPSGSQRTFRVFLRPSSGINYGAQGVTVNFKELNSGTVVHKVLELTLRNADALPRDYVAAVALDVGMPYDVDPRKPIPMRLELRNRNPLDIPNLTIRVTSPHFDATAVTSLGPLSEKTKDIDSITVPPTTAPGEADVVVQLLYQGQVVTSVTKNYRIIEYTELQKDVKEQQLFFKDVKTIMITNKGNVRNNANVSIPTSILKSLFLSSDLPYEVGRAQEGYRVIYWTIPLGPSDTRSFTYTENYRVLVLLLLLAIIAAVAYLFLRSPVVAVKEAVAMAHPEGVSDIKVRVFVKNRSARIVKELQITDRVPTLADVVKRDAPGSLVPNKMAVSDKHGTMLRWDLDILEPFEERILTYQVKSKLKIIGRMKLPNARIRFLHKGKERIVYSNNIELVEKFQDK